MMMTNRIIDYATLAADGMGGKVGKYVIKQCRQWLDICNGKKPEAYIDKRAWDMHTKLLQLVIIHPDTGKDMYSSLPDYALLFIFALLCTKGKDGRFFYNTGLCVIARKNYKTFVSAVIFILAMLTHPRFSRFFSVAPDYKLSSELKVAVDKIIKSSPLLQKRFKILRSEIRCTITDSTFVPLAYSNDKLDGKLATFFLADEAGAMDAYPVEAMRSSQINLQSKMGIIISTQYPNDNNGLIDEIDIAKKQLDGAYNSGRQYFSLLYEPDEEIVDNWQTDDRVLFQSNPLAIDSSELLKSLKTSRSVAVAYESRRENFLCKHCNIKYKGLGTEGYVDLKKKKKCSIAYNPDFWRGKKVYLGLDLSLSEDNTAVAMVTEQDGKIYAAVWGFIPANRIDIKSNKEHVNYARHIKNGECISCGDDVISYSFVEDFILSLEKNFGVDIAQVAYDPWNAISTVQKLEANGIECVQVKQHSSVLHPATKYLKEQILSGGFAYFANELLEINFANARCTEDTNLNKFVNKKRSAGKVDMVVSLINAMCLLHRHLLCAAEDFVIQY